MSLPRKVTIFSKKTQGHPDPYRTVWQMWTPWGKLKLHLFHRGDRDHAFHDHPADFWTFPLTSYVDHPFDPETRQPRPYELVRAFRVHYRPAEYAHKLIGRAEGHDGVSPLKRVWTIVWEKHNRRQWGFWQRLPSTWDRPTTQWTWMHWRTFLIATGQIEPTQAEVVTDLLRRAREK